VTAGTIATPHSTASEAGADALRAGGNALDAALAAAAALTVTYPHNCTLGGDLFALVAQPDGRVHAVNASGPAALATDAAALGRLSSTMPAVGVAPITVPGVVAGWDRLHRLGARLPWRDALVRATRLAAEGVRVAPGLAEAIDTSDDLRSDPGMSQVFAPGGVPLRRGDRLLQPRLAQTLRVLADDGPGALYRGRIGAALIAGLRDRGSALTEEDLARFAVEETDALEADVGDCQVLTCPPNSSGVLLAQAMLALRDSGLDDPLGRDAAGLAAIFLAGNLQRTDQLCDPRVRPFDREAWLGDERIGAIAALAASGQGDASQALGVIEGRPGGDTIGLVAADEEGRAVSLIQSLFHSFGSQVLEPSTGILLHNRGASFSLDPGHPNALAPGKRPAHTLMPVMVCRDGKLLGVLATMGGQIHAQIHAQVLLALLAGVPAPEAVAAPRFAVAGMETGEPESTARVERDCAPTVAAGLRRAGFEVVDVPRHSSFLGHVQAIWLDGVPLGASDPRSDGSAISVP
jgi:gamma-glutamyltranspeptidase